MGSHSAFLACSYISMCSPHCTRVGSRNSSSYLFDSSFSALKNCSKISVGHEILSNHAKSFSTCRQCLCGDDTFCEETEAMLLKRVLEKTCTVIGITFLLATYGTAISLITKGAGHRWLQSLKGASVATSTMTHLPKKYLQEDIQFTKEQQPRSRCPSSESDSVTCLIEYPSTSFDDNETHSSEQCRFFPNQSNHNSYNLFDDQSHECIHKKFPMYDLKGSYFWRRSYAQEAIFFVSNTKEWECSSMNSLGNGEGPTTNGRMEKFEIWLGALKEDAVKRGVSTKVLEDALQGIKPLSDILENDSNQPETQLTSKAYLERMINDHRVTKGVVAFEDNKFLLQDVSTKYGIPRKVLVAVWGIESSYGAFCGSWDVIQALVTLAFQSEKVTRANYFKEELVQALLLLEEGQICNGSTRLKGSWAGAMGQCQFMPSSLRQYGVDFDGDGYKDIWKSHADVLASMANYLVMHGWKVGSLLAQRVSILENIDKSILGLEVKKTITEWNHEYNVLGLEEQLEHSPTEMVSLVAPDGPSGATYIVGDNFRALMRYNTSSLYCLAVYELANEINKRMGFIDI